MIPQFPNVPGRLKGEKGEIAGWRATLYCATLFAFGLNIPTLSVVFLFLLFLDVIATWHVPSPDLRVLGMRFALLCAFLTTYFVILGFHSDLDAVAAVKSVAMTAGIYVLGYSIGRRTRLDGTTREWALVLLAAGFAVFAVASVLRTRTPGQELEFAERTARDAWTGTTNINATALGLIASLSMCQLLAVLFSLNVRKSGAQRMARWALVLVAAVAGAYSNLALQNRSPFVAMAIALCAALVVFARDREASFVQRLVRISAVATVVFTIVVLQLQDGSYMRSRTLYARFESSGLETIRYELWTRMLTHFFDSWAGGRVVDMEGMGYAHDLWLDVLYDSGIAPLIAILMFHALHVRPVAWLLRRWPGRELRYLVLGTLTAILVAYIGEPVIEASMMYFASTVFVLGLVAGTYMAGRRWVRAPT